MVRKENKIRGLKGKIVSFMSLISLTAAIFINAPAAIADPATNPLEGITLEGLGYIEYSNGQTGSPNDSTTDYNKFSLTRGYITVKKAQTSWMSFRVTMDIYQDDNGNYVFREKYLYGELKHSGFSVFTNIKAEIGMGHTPWLDFEGTVNPYRCQGKTASENAGLVNSADIGLGVMGNFGGKLEDAKAKTGNGSYDGRYGSWQLGVYNGGGYSATEKNENKIFAARATFRPLPDVIPGFQASYSGIFGKGNTADEPDYDFNLGMVSFEHPKVILAAQYFVGTGNAKGTLVDANGESLKSAGYSIFANVKPLPTNSNFAVFGRYDYFDNDKDAVVAEDAACATIIAGASYDLYKGNMVVVSYESTSYDDNAAGKGKTPVIDTNLGDDQKVQVIYQIKF